MISTSKDIGTISSKHKLPCPIDIGYTKFKVGLSTLSFVNFPENQPKTGGMNMKNNRRNSTFLKVMLCAILFISGMLIGIIVFESTRPGSDRIRIIETLKESEPENEDMIEPMLSFEEYYLLPNGTLASISETSHD